MNTSDSIDNETLNRYTCRENDPCHVGRCRQVAGLVSPCFLLVLLLGCRSATPSASADAKAAAAPSLEVDRVPVYLDKGYGYIDHLGHVVIPGPFKDADQFSEGLARVKDDKGFAYIDAAGQIAFRVTSDSPGRFAMGRAVILREPRHNWDQRGTLAQRSMGYLDRSGKVVIPLRYINADPFSDGLAAVQLPDGKFGYIDLQGRVVIAPMFDRASAFHDGLACAALGSSEGYIDRHGNMVAAAALDSNACRGHFADGRAPWTADGRAGFIDRDGKQVIAARYDRVESFSEGRAVFERDKRCGYLDTDGHEVIAASYRACSDFRDGLAPVLVGDRWAFINRGGATVLAAQYNDVHQPPHRNILGMWSDGQLRPPESLGHGLYEVELPDWSGLIDGTGKKVWSDD